MRGGDLLITGNAGPCAGLGMRGGRLYVGGDAGPRAGGAWPGARAGMAGGQLVIAGSAGDALGERMRRGVIVCHGAIGADAALGMRGGTIVAFGDLGGRFGAGMQRGTIVAFAAAPPWPAFRYDCLYDPVFVRLYMRALGLSEDDLRGAAQPDGTRSPHQGPLWGSPASRFRRYHGDINALGKGEVLVWQAVA
jgi:formylmethanofuran dehydrogenase subunit C